MSAALSNGVKIAYAILCDDVRREDNGKNIFIGVYANDIVFPSFPAVTTLRLVTRLLLPGPGQYLCEMRARYGETEVLRLRLVTNSVDGSNETSSSPPFAANFEHSDVLTFEVRSAEADEWLPVLVMPVMDATSSSALPPPS